MGLLDWIQFFKREKRNSPTREEKLRVAIGTGHEEEAEQLMEQGARTPDLLNATIASGYYKIALSLVSRGADFDQESVRVLALAAHDEKNRHLAAHSDYSPMHLLSGTIPSYEPFLSPTLRELIWCCLETGGLDWYRVYSLEGASFERHHSFDRCAADRLIANACPEFSERLHLVLTSRGEPLTRSEPEALTQQDLDCLLAETFDRRGEALDCGRREQRISSLLTRGANPNVHSHYPILNQQATLVGRAVQTGDCQMLEKLLAFGGIVDPLGLDGLVHASMEIFHFDMGGMTSFQQPYLLNMINLIERHSTIDWARMIPRPTSFFSRMLSETWGVGLSESNEQVFVLDLLAEHFPQMEALRQKRQLEAAAQGGAQGKARRL